MTLTKKQYQRQFKQLMSGHQGLIYKVIRAYTFKVEDHDDLYQEIAAQVWRSLPAFKGEAKVSTWMYKVALFTAMNWSKQHRKHSVTDENVDPASLSSDSSTNHNVDWLYEKIHQLNEVDRSLMLLALEGYGYKEMSELMGMTSNLVGVRINRIKKRLSQSD